MGRIEETVGEGAWLLEGNRENSEALVARALVSPMTDQVVVRLLNYQPEEVTVFENSKIASIELVDELVLSETTVGSVQSAEITTEQEAVATEGHGRLVWIRTRPQTEGRIRPAFV